MIEIKFFFIISFNFIIKGYSNESNERPEVEVESIPEVSVGFVVTPKKIGEIEFEVEVQEVLPRDVSKVPEIDSINEVNDFKILVLINFHFNYLIKRISIRALALNLI